MSEGRSARPFARGVKNRQRLPYMIFGRIQGTGTATVVAGSHELTIVDNGVGDWSLNFVQAFQQVPIVVATPISTVGDVILSINTVSASTVRIKAWDGTDGTTAKDIDFHVMITGSDAADEV